MKNVYIMRINWYNYDSAWCEGEAFFQLSRCKDRARVLLEENYRASIKQHKLEDAEMIFHESGDGDYFTISIAARYPGESDRFLGDAEIHRVPLVESVNDASD